MPRKKTQRKAQWINQLAALKRLLYDGELGPYDRPLVQAVCDRVYVSVTGPERKAIKEAWERLCDRKYTTS